MLTARRIDQDFKAERYDAMIQALSVQAGGWPLPLRVRLSEHPASAVALCLRRLMELNYLPNDHRLEMIRQLLDWQEADGSLGHDPLATAGAIAAWGRVIRDTLGTPDPRLQEAQTRALVALASMQQSSTSDPCSSMLQEANNAPLFIHPSDRTTEQRALVGAFILYLLAGDTQFQQLIDYASLMNWFEDHQDRLEPSTRELWNMARLDSPVYPHPGHAGDPGDSGSARSKNTSALAA